MATIERKCQRCGKVFQAKTADVKRGWAKCCSKSCAAAKREKTLNRGLHFEDAGIEAEDQSWDAHKIWMG